MANIGYIQVNRHCNNACHFCSNPSNGNNITYERGIELIDDFIERGYKGIIFTGGEPTLSPDLPKWLAYTVEKGIENRMISNGMMCSDSQFMKRLVDAGLESVHFSVFSYHYKVHDFLSDTQGSWKKLMLSISNALGYGVDVRINTVMNHYNQGHLDTTVKYLLGRFPDIRHFIWNNLDPSMMRKTDTALSTLPDFKTSGKSVVRAMKFLESKNKTFRVESLPLCFMRGYEWAAMETRKIVKKEERIVHFLDERNSTYQPTEWFQHKKLPECNSCDLNSVCGGLYDFEDIYKHIKVTAQRVTNEEKKVIISKIKSSL